MKYSQESRLITLTTPLGTDKLLLAGFSGHEAMSRLFSFHLDLLTQEGPIAFSDIVGQNVSISVQQSNNSLRYFNGIVSRFTESGADTTFMHYQMEVVPWTWLLTRYANCKIFHNLSVLDIIQQIFSDFGFSDYRLSTSATYPPLEYTVQYRETAFNFISRLMEHNGIFYFFEHEEGKHTMVIADSSSAHQALPGFASAGYNLAGGGLDEDDVVNSWSMRRDLRSGKYTLTDYNFQTPSASLESNEPTIYGIGNNSGYEVFDYPGLFTNRADGITAAKLRMAEIEAGHQVATGSGVCRAFTTGYKFQLEDHPQADNNASYVLTEVQHRASVVGHYTTSGGSGDHYSNHFSCIPLDVPYRPERLTPKPFVQGPQTAVVVNKTAADSSSSSEEIWVDNFGRVIVEFFWDRDNRCSAWVRVSQAWAGQGYGAMAIPRVGQEVIVSFLEGDPDHPIITGRVYNANETIPYALPAYQTRSTFMTRSSKGGSASTYNELRFEDKMGEEQVFLRSQFDQDNYVLNDSRERIGNNRSLIVTKDQMESVGGDLHSKVTGNVFEKVTGNTNLQVTGDVKDAVTGNVNSQITGNFVEAVTGDWNSNVTGNINQKAGQNLSIQVGQNLYEKSGTNFAHEAGQVIHLKAGMTVVLEAGVGITLKVGGNSVVLTPAGVSITGTLVQINSGGSAGSGCGSSPTDPASPMSPDDPKDPDKADDGSKGTKM